MKALCENPPEKPVIYPNVTSTHTMPVNFVKFKMDNDMKHYPSLKQWEEYFFEEDKTTGSSNSASVIFLICC